MTRKQRRNIVKVEKTHHEQLIRILFGKTYYTFVFEQVVFTVLLKYRCGKTHAFISKNMLMRQNVALVRVICNKATEQDISSEAYGFNNKNTGL